MSTRENESLSSFRIIRYTLKQYKPKYRLLKNKGTILVVLWSCLVNNVFQFLVVGSKTLSHNQNEVSHFPSGIILISLALLFPLGGWLADSYLGRYKVVRYSTWIMWISIITMTVWCILDEYVIGEHNNTRVAIDVVLCIVLGIGLGGFQANIVQLGIDQLTDASSTEITSFITSYVFTLFSSGILFPFVNNCYANLGITTNISTLLVLMYVAVCLTLAMCLDFLFGSWLVRESVPGTSDSITVIAKVVKFVIVNRNRISDEAVDMFDAAKHMFGGPFNNQQVENVRKFLTMIVIVAVGSVTGGQIIVLSYAQEELQLRFSDWNDSSCYERISISYSDCIFGTIVILLYEIFISPLFGRCIPVLSTVNVYIIGIFLSLLRIFAFLGIEVRAFLEQSSHNSTTGASKSCIHDGNYKIHFSPMWVIVVGSLEGLYSLLFILSWYKFMWARSPSTMKGLTIGIAYAFLGLGAMLQSAISSPFLFIHNISWRELPLSCGIWYYMMQVVIVAIILGLSVIVVKRYKQGQKIELGLNPAPVVEFEDELYT